MMTQNLPYSEEKEKYPHQHRESITRLSGLEKFKGSKLFKEEISKCHQTINMHETTEN